MKWDTDPKQDRFDPRDSRKTMKAVVTSGNGGYDQLQCRVVNLSMLEPGEVLLKVAGAGACHSDVAVYEQFDETTVGPQLAPAYTLGHETAGWIDK